MAGKKRTSDEAGVATRSGGRAKAARTSPTSKPAGKRGPKALATADFKARALPLHISVTHTPPAIDGDTADAATVEATTAAVAVEKDPGFLGTLSLLPSTFSTGSYGWKGSKRLTVELADSAGGDEKEKVQVMLTINATVIGSKHQEKEDGAPGEGAEKEENVHEEAAAAETENKAAETEEA